MSMCGICQWNKCDGIFFVTVLCVSRLKHCGLFTQIGYVGLKWGGPRNYEVIISSTKLSQKIGT